MTEIWGQPHILTEVKGASRSILSSLLKRCPPDPATFLQHPQVILAPCRRFPGLSRFVDDNSPHRGSTPPSFHTRQEPHMGFFTEFKEFAVKGNVMDLAVGVIIGAAFGKIVDSIVNDLIMPLVGKVVGGLDFSNYYIALAGQDPTLPLLEAKKIGAVFAYGNFLTVALNFVILAFIIFLMIKQINRLKKEAPAAAPAATPEDVVLLREIRDSLKK
jgi:large conductance mechanosensitive channel